MGHIETAAGQLEAAAGQVETPHSEPGFLFHQLELTVLAFKTSNTDLFLID